MGRRNLTDRSWLDERSKGTWVMSGTSAGIDPRGKTYIVLYWKPVRGVTGYHLFRREEGQVGEPTLLNPDGPIRSVQSCDELEALVPRRSPEWRMLADAFSSLRTRDSLKIVPDALRRARLEDVSVVVGSRFLTSAATLGPVRRDLALRRQDPCDALERGLSEEEEAIFDLLATVNLKLRLARGLAYIDHAVTPHQRYVYELVGVTAEGDRRVLAKDIMLQAGHFVLPNPPKWFRLAAGDRKVLALWNRNPYAHSYMIRRSADPDAGYEIVNAEPIFYDVEHDLAGDELDPHRPGYVDFQRWSPDGLPIPHDVDGVSIDGPENNTIYYYQVASRDILGRMGSWSPHRSARPTDRTPPAAPADFRVQPSAAPLGLALSWQKVTRDVDGHQILDPIQTYRIYRAETLDELEDLGELAGYEIATVTADPTDPAVATLQWLDTDPILAPAYGETDFWYRVRCEDDHGNVGSPSAALSGRIPDTTPPDFTRVTGADGHADHITVYWGANSEPDLAGYQVYRGICDRGKYYFRRQDEKPQQGCGFVLVGELSRAEAEQRLAATGRIYFEDYSVPAGSVLCYAYWIRAFDRAQNLYPGLYGCPASPDEYVCQRLYEETPPPVPIITDLRARSNAVLVEWIASPVQDLRAFHIYRSEEETVEPERVGCVLTDGTVLSAKWEGMKPTCEDIPAEPDPDTVRGSFLDREVEPHRVYWYRVSALDWLGNESQGSDITAIPAISTFTYSLDLPVTPAVLAPAAPTEEGCGLLVSWNPPFKPEAVEGFLVFRSLSSTGSFRQVSPLVTGNSFSDESALRGTDYWYRVQTMDRAGKLSEPSPPVHHRY